MTKLATKFALAIPVFLAGCAEEAMTDRKKNGVALWAIVGLVAVFVEYPLSIGRVYG